MGIRVESHDVNIPFVTSRATIYYESTKPALPHCKAKREIINRVKIECYFRLVLAQDLKGSAESA